MSGLVRADGMTPLISEVRRDEGIPTISRDGYTNIFSGLGSVQDSDKQTNFFRDMRLGQKKLEEIFESDGLGRRIVEEPAEDMCREWFTVDGDEGEAVLDALEQINAQAIFTEAVTWSRLYGGAALLLVTEDDLNFESPLREDAIQKVFGIKVFDRFSMNSDPNGGLSDNPVSRLEGLPKYYLIKQSRRTYDPKLTSIGAYRVHESRLVRVPGKRMPMAVRHDSLEGWEASVLQGAWTALRRYGATLGYGSNIMKDYVQAVLAVKGLTNLVAAGREEVVQGRLRMLDMSRSILNAMVIDGDGEVYEKKSNSVAGMSDMLDKFIESVSSATGIPVTKLVGRSPGGMNSTGEFDMGSYYDMLKGEQKRVVLPMAETLVRLIYKSKEGPTGGTEPEAWSIRFNSLRQPTDKDTAEIRKIVAETDKIYVDSGILSPKEVADSRFGQEAWSIETSLADDTDRSETASLDPEEEADILIKTAKATKPAPAESKP